MSLPFDQQKTQSGNSIFEDVYVYGNIEVNSGHLIMIGENGIKYKLSVTNVGILTAIPL